jgi:hypothetical protein
VSEKAKIGVRSEGNIIVGRGGKINGDHERPLDTPTAIKGKDGLVKDENAKEPGEKAHKVGDGGEGPCIA